MWTQSLVPFHLAAILVLASGPFLPADSAPLPPLAEDLFLSGRGAQRVSSTHRVAELLEVEA